MNLLLAAALALTAPTEAPAGLSHYQHESLVAACNAGEPHGLCESTMVAILIESSACVDLVGDDGTSFGCGQLQLPTASELRPGVTAKQLVKNRALNLRLTADNLSRCRLRYGDWRRMMLCHNSPRRAAAYTDEQVAADPYVMRARRALAFLRERYGAQ